MINVKTRLYKKDYLGLKCIHTKQLATVLVYSTSSKYRKLPPPQKKFILKLSKLRNIFDWERNNTYFKNAMSGSKLVMLSSLYHFTIITILKNILQYKLKKKILWRVTYQIPHWQKMVKGSTQRASWPHTISSLNNTGSFNGASKIGNQRIETECIFFLLQ